MNEATETAIFCNRLQDCGAMVRTIKGDIYGANGWPDRLIVHRDWCGLVEFKYGDKGKLTPLQLHTLQELNRVRARSAFLVWMYDDGSWELNSFDWNSQTWSCTEFPSRDAVKFLGLVAG